MLVLLELKIGVGFIYLLVEMATPYSSASSMSPKVSSLPTLSVTRGLRLCMTVHQLRIGLPCLVVARFFSFHYKVKPHPHGCTE